MTDCKVYYYDELLTGTFEMYDENAGYGSATFDKKITGIWTGKENYTLQELYTDEANCLYAVFDHGLTICSCPEEDGLTENEELWRVFLEWSAEIHVVAYPDRIEEEESPYTQEEIDQIRIDSLKRRKRF